MDIDVRTSKLFLTSFWWNSDFRSRHRLVWVLSHSPSVKIHNVALKYNTYYFDVWLTVHRSSMWIKKPTRCHLVLYLFLLYKLLFISCSTCFGPPCAHLQELTSYWYFFTCGVVPWLCRQSDPVGWMSVHWEVHNQPTGSDCLHSHGTTPHVKKYH